MSQGNWDRYSPSTWFRDLQFYIHSLACVYLVLCSVTICVNSCDYHHSQDTGQFHHPKGLWCCPFIATAISLPPWSLATTDLFSLPIILSFQEWYTNEIMRYVIFWDRLFFTQCNSLEIQAGNVSCINSSFSFLSCIPCCGCIIA